MSSKSKMYDDQPIAWRLGYRDATKGQAAWPPGDPHREAEYRAGHRQALSDIHDTPETEDALDAAEEAEEEECEAPSHASVLLSLGYLGRRDGVLSEGEVVVEAFGSETEARADLAHAAWAFPDSGSTLRAVEVVGRWCVVGGPAQTVGEGTSPEVSL